MCMASNHFDYQKFFRHLVAFLFLSEEKNLYIDRKFGTIRERALIYMYDLAEDTGCI